MEPAIKNGDVLIVSRLRYGLRLPWQKNYLVFWARPKAGEVVVFYTPTGELAVKRCTQPPASLMGESSVAVIEGKLFYAQGDNGFASYDSRFYGFVNTENIIGKVLGY